MQVIVEDSRSSNYAYFTITQNKFFLKDTLGRTLHILLPRFERFLEQSHVSTGGHFALPNDSSYTQSG
jgi:hypothetical protein